VPSIRYGDCSLEGRSVTVTKRQIILILVVRKTHISLLEGCSGVIMGGWDAENANHVDGKECDEVELHAEELWVGLAVK
jgi:hypothetical protein